MDNIFKSQWLQSMGVFDEKKMMNHQPMDQIQLIEPLQYLVIQLLLLFMVIGGKKFDADYYRNKNKQDNTRCDYISIGSRYIEIGCGCAHIGTACIDIVMKIHKIGCDYIAIGSGCIETGYGLIKTYDVAETGCGDIKIKCDGIARVYMVNVKYVIEDVEGVKEDVHKVVQKLIEKVQKIIEDVMQDVEQVKEVMEQ
eukprot:234562_1